MSSVCAMLQSQVPEDAAVGVQVGPFKSFFVWMA